MQNPTIELKGATYAKRAFNSNIKYNANTNYKLQDNQAYYKAIINKETGQLFLACYAITYFNIFENITIIHKSLIHFN